MAMAILGSGVEAFPVPRAWLSDVDRAFADEVRSYVDKHIILKRQSEPVDTGMLSAAWQGISVDLGLQSAIWPDAVGGAGQNSHAAAMLLTAVTEQVARGDVGLAMLLASTQAMVAAGVVGAAEDEARMTKWAKPFVSDRAVRVALVLPAMARGPGGPLDGDGRKVQVSAAFEGDGSSLTASRARPLCGGAEADWLGVVTVDQGEPSLWWVAAHAAGLTRGEPLKQTGFGACRNADIRFSGVRVEEADRWLRGTTAVHSLSTWLQLLASASCIGAMFAAFEILSEWGEARVIKGRGQVFKDNPLTASVMAELAGSLHRDRLLVYNLAHMVAHPEDHGPAGGDTVHVAASHIAQHVAHSAEHATNRAMELMASAGYAREWHLERYWRDIKCVQSCLGGPELSSMRVARHYYGSRCR